MVRDELARKFMVRTLRESRRTISEISIETPFSSNHQELTIGLYAPRINMATGPEPNYKLLAAKFETFMASSGVQERLAGQIMRACQTIDIVTFFATGSGGNSGVFRMPGGRPKAGEALECGPSLPQRLRWGTFPSC